MRLPSTIRFIDEDTKKAFYNLEQGDDTERTLFTAINNALDKLEEDAFCGTQIPKKLIPKTYSRNHKAKNLWKYDLPKGWRLIYSIIDDESVIVSVVLEWFDHKNYEKRFGY